MINLAAVTHGPYPLAEGIAKTEEIVRNELSICGVPFVTIPPKDQGEIQSSIGGKLGEFYFFRAWYYWVVTGNVPLVVAKELYTDPIGVKDVRVAGHCGCPPPEDPWITWLTTEGKTLVNIKEKAQVDQFLSSGVFKKEDVMMFQFAEPSDFPNLGSGFITCYHIDSQKGLNLFLKALRDHQLV